jgi:hypothetical protein
MTDRADRGAEQPIDRRKLRVWATVKEAYRICFANLGLWLKLSIVPVALLIALWVTAVSVLPGPAEAAPDSFPALQSALMLLCIIVMFLCEIPLVTAWHRFILTHDDVFSHRYLVGNREWRYLLKLLLITLIACLVFIMVAIVNTLVLVPMLMAGSGVESANTMVFEVFIAVVSLGVYALLIFVFAHLFLMLPASAIGRKMTRRAAKTAIVSNRGRLTAVFAVGALPISLMSLLLTSIFGAKGDAIFVSGDLVVYVPTLIFAPVIVGLLSIAYRDLVQMPEAAGEASSQIHQATPCSN